MNIKKFVQERDEALLSLDEKKIRGGDTMSKPRYDWWAYMKAISRKYYARKDKELHGMAEKEQQAVKAAIDQTLDLPDGPDRMEVVKLVLLKGTHRIPGAAMEIPCSERTAAQWHGDFIKLVAKNYGLLDESLH